MNSDIILIQIINHLPSLLINIISFEWLAEYTGYGDWWHGVYLHAPVMGNLANTFPYWIQYTYEEHSIKTLAGFVQVSWALPSDAKLYFFGSYYHFSAFTYSMIVFWGALALSWMGAGFTRKWMYWRLSVTIVYIVNILIYFTLQYKRVLVNVPYDAHIKLCMATKTFSTWFCANPIPNHLIANANGFNASGIYWFQTLTKSTAYMCLLIPTLLSVALCVVCLINMRGTTIRR